jgi:16S rRNA U1498 N3-methylase RsmE
MLKGQYRFLAANSEEITLSKSDVCLTPSDLHKLIHVLRATVGMEINIICRTTGKIFLARLRTISPEVKIEILKLLDSAPPTRQTHRALGGTVQGREK